MSIPKIIHQIAPADKDNWHLFWHKCHDSWKQNFPDYTIKLWNDKEDIDNFVKESYPQFWNVYNAFPFHIMKIDFVRLCILHKYGGIYADMDFFCYKNFNNYLTEDIYFLENVIFEYTDANYENSMMASIPDHKILEELLKYSKTCFIHFRNTFKRDNDNWRNQKNDNCVNNTTGSGMISEGINTLKKYFKINVFKAALFNNRPGSYDNDFYTKHLHTSIWGKEYLKNSCSRFNGEKTVLDGLLIINGGLFSTSYQSCKEHLEEIKKHNQNVYLIKNEEYNFFYDYTLGNYLKDNNVKRINEIVIKR